MTITFRGGLLPNDPTKRRLRLANYLTGATLPALPPAADWDTKVSGFGVLGNDSWGDCDEAMKLHALQTWTANSGTELVPTTADAIRAYSEITGFDPNAGPPGSNPTDQGTVMQEALNFWRTTGLLVGGKRHKIVAFAQVDHAKPAEMQAAVALFGEVLVGIDFPDTAMGQFNRGVPWDYVPGTPKPNEGHAVCAAHYDAATGRWWFVTWGREQEATAAFVAHYVSEAWVAAAPEWVKANGLTVTGLDTHAWGADFQDLTGDPNPFPAPAPTPAPPGPPPFPGPLAASVQRWAGNPDVARFVGEHHTLKAQRAAASALADIFAQPRA